LGKIEPVANTNFESIDAYLATKPADVVTVLERVRAAIHKAVPEAEEAISYQIPAFKVKKRVFLFFAGWKEHYSLYPSSPALVAEFAEELAGCELDKGTIRFPLSKPVPVKLIGRIAKFRLNEHMAMLEAKAAAKKR